MTAAKKPFGFCDSEHWLCSSFCNVNEDTKQIIPPSPFPLFLIEYVWPLRRRHCHYADTPAPFTSTNTIKSKFKHITMKIVCYCWFGTSLPSVKPTDTRQLHFWTIYCTIVTVCSHIVFSQHSCVHEFLFRTKRWKTKQNKSTSLV